MSYIAQNYLGTKNVTNKCRDLRLMTWQRLFAMGAEMLKGLQKIFQGRKTQRQ